MTQLKKVANQLLTCFSEDTLQKIATDVKLIQRNRQFSLKHLLWLCVFQQKTVGQSSLVDMCTAIWQNFDVTISPEGLNQRFNQSSVNFLKQLLLSLIEQQLPELSTISHDFSVHFNRIRILDSTSFQIANSFENKYPGNGGSGKKAAAKIHVEYDLTTGSFLHLAVGPGKIHDSKFLPHSSSDIQPNDLCIRDLGYFKFTDLAEWHNKDGYFLSRIKANSTVFIKSQKKGSLNERYTAVDWDDYLPHISSGESIELPEVYMGRAKSFPARLILYRLTPEQLSKRRRKQQKISSDMNFNYSEKAVKLSEFNLFITNSPIEKLGKEDVCRMYSLRWQIELLFKAWKSYLDIHHSKNSKVERFECTLYGRLILAILSTSLVFQLRAHLYRKKKKELSELKSFKLICSFIERFGLHICIKPNLASLIELIHKLFSAIDWLGTKCHRYEKQTVFNILHVPSF